MSHKKVALFSAAATIAICALQSQGAVAAEAAAVSAPATVTEIIVTANKRQENIQNVGMSIQAASGDKLTQMGIHDTESLSKIVPGFQFTPTYYGTNVFTIRGVGFQDTSLAGSPTVSVYLDEAPLPFSALTNGATLDLQRVEVLKGPQGTLFGNNATGGAVNYIANKPTDTFQAGADLSYGTFNDTDMSGYLSGPVMDGLDLRLALRRDSSGAWQKGYGPQSGQSTGGGKDFTNGRFSVLWKPNDKFKALLTLNGWQDKGYNQDGQLFGIAELSELAPLSPSIANYPLAPHNDQAANANNCVNTSPFDPIAGQATTLTTNGVRNPGVFGTIPNPGANANPTGPVESEGAGSIVQAGGQPTSCTPARKNNTYFDFTLRTDYDLGHDMTLTTLAQYQKFNRAAGIDGSGMNIQDYQSYQRGKIESAYAEIRLAGKWNGKGTWIIGANYENDNTWDSFLQTYNASSASPTVFINPNFLAGVDSGVLFGHPGTGAPLPQNLFPVTVLEAGPLGPLAGILGAPGGPTSLALGPTRPEDRQLTNTFAVYASGEYPILDNLTLLGGVRFTEEDKKGGVCGNDGGDGTWAQVSYTLQSFYYPPSSSSAASAAGTCASTGPGPTYNTPGLGLGSGGGLIYSHLNQNNVAWRAGLNWKVTSRTLLYVNISQGYKGGSYPTVALASLVQTHPVVQEALLSYEFGFKSSIFDRQLTLNGAGFYYDYTNKQILGAVADAVYGALPSLVNVPKSHVIGFELSGVYAPDWLKGLTITPSVSYQYSQVDKSSKNTCAPPPAQNPTISGPTPNAPVIGPNGYTGAGENPNNTLDGLSPNVPGQIYCKAGDFYGFDAYGEYADFTGEKFPQAPVWQANIDAEYDWKIRDDITAFIGANYAYVSGTTSFFVNRNPIPAYLNIGVNGPYPYFGGYLNAAGQIVANPVGPLPTNHANNPLDVPAYGLLDLRAGVSKDNWRFQVWGRNVGNTWYWTSAVHVNDVLLRYTGMPTTVGFTLTYKYH
jgi:outer membrane receptor protein involved in Fe transport